MNAGLPTQLGAPFRALAAVLRPARGALGLTGLYFVLVALVLGGTGWALTTGRPALTDALLRYVFPEDWLRWVEPLAQGLLSGQGNVVFVNAALMTGIAVAAALLFPLKERVSKVFERGAPWAPAAPVRELPLAFQAFEETRIFLVYLSLQLTLFWVGLSPNPVRQTFAAGASTVLLWIQMTLDFGSPALQRRGRRYADIARLLLRRPFAALGFGALFAAPAQLAGLMLAPQAALAPERTLALLYGVTALSLPLAVWGGTRFGAELVELPVEPLRGLRRLAGNLAVTALVVVNLASAGLALRTLHRMSQVLKCEYALVPDSWRVKTGLLDAFAADRVQLDASIEVDVRNPTPFDLEIHDLTFDVRHQGEPVAAPRLTGVRVPAGETRRQRLSLALPIALKTLGKGLGLLDPGWAVTLQLEVLPGTSVPLRLVKPEPTPR